MTSYNKQKLNMSSIRLYHILLKKISVADGKAGSIKTQEKILLYFTPIEQCKKILGEFESRLSLLVI